MLNSSQKESNFQDIEHASRELRKAPEGQTAGGDWASVTIDLLLSLLSLAHRAHRSLAQVAFFYLLPHLTGPQLKPILQVFSRYSLMFEAGFLLVLLGL